MEDDGAGPARRQSVTPRDEATVRSSTADHSRRGALLDLGAALALPLTLLSAILIVGGFWSPWLNEIGTPRPGSGFGATITLTNSGSDITFSGLFAFISARQTNLGAFSPLVASLYIWDALPIFGVVLAVALWRGRATPHWLVGVYAAWLLFITAVTGVGAYRALVVLPGRPCGGNCSDPYFTFHWQIAWGIWLTLGAVVLAWVAFAALWLRRTAPGAAAAGADPDAARDDGASLAPQTPHRTPSRSTMVGAGVFTLGAAIWAVGLYLVPWLTAGCVGVPLSIAHFSRGSCMGLDGYDMLIAGLHSAGWADALAVATAALHSVELLAVAGGVLAWLLWRPGRAFSLRAVVVVAAVWLLLVTLAFIVGWQGTAANLGQPAQLVFGARGMWAVGPGVWLCAVGILLAWVGGIVVWVGGRSGGDAPRTGIHQLHIIGG